MAFDLEERRFRSDKQEITLFAGQQTFIGLFLILLHALINHNLHITIFECFSVVLIMHYSYIRLTTT